MNDLVTHDPQISAAEPEKKPGFFRALPGKLTRFFRRLHRCCPVPARVLFCLALVAVLLQVGFSLSPGFADFYNRYPGAWFRAALAILTSWFPFSLAETALMLLPVVVVLMLIHIFHVSKKTLRDMARLTLTMLSALTLFFTTFVFGFSAGYRGSSLSDKLGLPQNTVSPEELDRTAEWLIEQINGLVPEISYRYGDFSVMPYGLGEMNRKLQEAYRLASEDYSFLPVFPSRIKTIVLSEPMTYTHISGVYTYFTGESNLNVNFPDYTLPYTAAHELAHQRGIAREEEANFIAFLICQKSDDPYIRYSGCVSLYEYVISALYRADKTLYYARSATAPTTVRYEMSAYNRFFSQYEKSVAATVSNTVNNAYLQIQGEKAGSKSYGLVVDLAVAYVNARETA